MELVKGVPITQYCDEHHLTPQQRLELFVPVCRAVQHARQKGIIHREIKPTNVLVAEYDDRPVPKIIDFGVAKAIQQRLTERTVFTQLAQAVGTIEYMSPEQAKLNELDIDTRTDVYSLGVLLYELLTGETPYDRQRLRSAAFDELLRIIREEEPPKPSLRLSSSQSLPSIAARRHVEPKRLSTLVRGDLDWIVMKALGKDRSRRCAKANAFARDVEHCLSGETIGRFLLPVVLRHLRTTSTSSGGDAAGWAAGAQGGRSQSNPMAPNCLRISDKSQTRTVLAPPTANRLPSGLKQRRSMWVVSGDSSVANVCPVVGSTSRIAKRV